MPRPRTDNVTTSTIPTYPCYRGLPDGSKDTHDFVLMPGGQMRCRYCNAERQGRRP